jgi:mRNA interferase MazF
VNNLLVKRGDIYYADLSPVIGSEQGGVRPVLIVQNDIGNKYSPTVIAAAITSQINKAKLPTHIEMSAKEYGLPKDSVILLEQIRTIDKKRLKEKIGHLDDELMEKVNDALSISFGLLEV